VGTGLAGGRAGFAVSGSPALGPHGPGGQGVAESDLGLGFLLFLDGLEIDVPAADNRPEALENSRKNV
jgi:hypothetical protein